MDWPFGRWPLFCPPFRLWISMAPDNTLNVVKAPYKFYRLDYTFRSRQSVASGRLHHLPECICAAAALSWANGSLGCSRTRAVSVAWASACTVSNEALSNRISQWSHLYRYTAACFRLASARDFKVLYFFILWWGKKDETLTAISFIFMSTKFNAIKYLNYVGYIIFLFKGSICINYILNF